MRITLNPLASDSLSFKANTHPQTLVTAQQFSLYDEHLCASASPKRWKWIIDFALGMGMMKNTLKWLFKFWNGGEFPRESDKVVLLVLELIQYRLKWFLAAAPVGWCGTAAQCELESIREMHFRCSCGEKIFSGKSISMCACGASCTSRDSDWNKSASCPGKLSAFDAKKCWPKPHCLLSENARNSLRWRL